MTDDTDEWAYQRQCIDMLEKAKSEILEITGIDSLYPKPEVPKVLTPLEEQDRVWKLLVQAAKN